MRQEKDSLGILSLPDKVYYGIQTERARQNFDISGKVVGEYPELIQSLAMIKKAAALANLKIGVLDSQIANAIAKAATEIVDGQMADQFPVDIFQGGGGTSTNMNMNEVLAHRANEILTGQKGYDQVHPNDHVNMGQSTNDVIPSAMMMACHTLCNKLIKSIEVLEKILLKKKSQFQDVVKIGRTCLQDALPITLGQEFSGYHAFVKRQKNHLMVLSEECLSIPLTATAIGTGLGTAPGYKKAIFKNLSNISGWPICMDDNLFDGLQNTDFYLRLSSILKSLAAGLSKMSADFRLMSSGPRAGFREIELPAVQPGSSIMPGKINPVMPEMMIQVAYRIIGNDTTITMAVEGGELDLNIWESLITCCLMESFQLLINSIIKFSNKCVTGIRANREICLHSAASSLALSTALVPLFGYAKISKITREAFEQDKSIRDVVVHKGLLSEKEADKLLDPEKMTRNNS